MTIRGSAPTLAQLRERREEILRISAARGAREVRVFGSVANDRARGGSDVDLLVELEPGRGVLDLSGLILDLEDALGCRVDIVEAGGRSELAQRIERSALPL